MEVTGREMSRRAALGAIGATALMPRAARAQGLFINPFEERAIGVASHQKAIAQDGGLYPRPAIGRYVQELGMRVAQTSARHPDQFVFTVVNNPVPNACTRLGGFIYVNAGYLPWFDDEAELASTLGHEVGHAIKRHVAHAINRENVSDRVIGLRALFRPQETEAMKIRANLALKSFGRDQENEADGVSVSALGKLGYDPFAMSTKLYKNLLNERLYGGSDVPEALRTHPFTVDRIRATTATARSIAAIPGTGTGTRNRDRYLDLINGLPIGRDPMYGAAPVRVRVIPVPAGATVATLAARMAPSPMRQRLFMAINGLDGDADLAKLTRVKLLV